MSNFNSTLTAERLRELLHYDAETGVFIWIGSLNPRVPNGSVAGTVRGKGYLASFLDKKPYYLHRVAWLYFHGVWPAGQIDHRDGDRKNNRISNLRDVMPRTNSQNLHKARTGSAAGLLGANRHGNSWTAHIRIDGERKHLGSFPTAQLAHEAYIAAKRKYHPGCTI